MMYKKIPLDGYQKLGLYPVYCNSVYKGKEPLTIVGLRNGQVELQGDYSGGTHHVIQQDWFSIKDCYLIKTVCEEQLKENGCQIHNLFCCGGGSIVTVHSDEYFKNIHDKK